MGKIFVTRSFLPEKDEYIRYVSQIYNNGVLTNQGPLLEQLEAELSDFLDAPHFHYVTNGTVALQFALKALGIEDGEIITTPFSYVATTSSILWERCKPVFVDIEAGNFTIDPDRIEEAVTPKTKAIMPVHVFGYSCAIEKIRAVADRHGLKVIYDAAHAFGSRRGGKSLCSCGGDVSTCSFHATKLFHTVEGGACIVRDKDVSGRLDLIKRFGHEGDTHFREGINGKQSEFHAAMGLANFPHIGEIIADRRRVSEMYDALLENRLGRPEKQPGLEYNYAYYPVVFESEKQLLNVFRALNAGDIYPRRYFYPSLNKLPYLKEKTDCPVSEDISRRVACLPLFVGLPESSIEKIAKTIKENL